jgi:hypothetical protein
MTAPWTDGRTDRRTKRFLAEREKKEKERGNYQTKKRGDSLQRHKAAKKVRFSRPLNNARLSSHTI